MCCWINSEAKTQVKMQLSGLLSGSQGDFSSLLLKICSKDRNHWYRLEFIRSTEIQILRLRSIVRICILTRSPRHNGARNMWEAGLSCSPEAPRRSLGEREPPKEQFLSGLVSCLITHQICTTGMRSEGSAKELGES